MRHLQYQQIQFSLFSECKYMLTRQCLKKKIKFENYNSYFTFMYLVEFGLVAGELIISKSEIGTIAYVNDKVLVVNFLLKTSIFLLANDH